MMKVLFTMVRVNTEEVLKRFPPVHPQVWSHHSTIEWKPERLEVPIGEEVRLQILGRLTTERVDVLLVDNPLSKNRYPHITLSTAEGVPPVESNRELEQYYDKIEQLDEWIDGTVSAQWQR